MITTSIPDTGMRFDWYQATIQEHPGIVLEKVRSLGHSLAPADALARRYRFDQGFQVRHHQKGVVATVLAGGNGIHPHAFASGEATDDFCALVRQEWPGRHLVTRMDAALDFNEPGCYQRLRKVARRIAQEHRLSFPQIADPLNAKAGRTQYIGSPSSDYRGRLYEKGLERLAELRSSGLARGLDVTQLRNEVTGELVKPEDWVRIELQARPKGEEARRKAAEVEPAQAWTFTSWSHHLAREALALNLERAFIRTRRHSQDEAALRWMCYQYAAPLLRLADDLGDFACVGKQIEEWLGQIRRGSK